MLSKIVTLASICLSSAISLGQNMMPVDYLHIYDPYASATEVYLGDPNNPTVTLYIPFGMLSPHGFPYTGNPNPPIQEGGNATLTSPSGTSQYDVQETRANTAVGEEDHSLMQFASDLTSSMDENDVDNATDSYLNDLDDLDSFTGTNNLYAPFSVNTLLNFSSAEQSCLFTLTIPQPSPWDDIFENFFNDSLFMNSNQSSGMFNAFFTTGICPGSGCSGILPGGTSSWGGAVPCPLHAPGHAGNTIIVSWDTLDIRYRKAITSLIQKRRAIRHQFWIDVNTAITTQDFEDLIADNIYYRTLAYDDFRQDIIDAWNILNP